MNISNVLHNVGAAIMGAITAFFVYVPDAAMEVWKSSPEALRALVPEPYIPVITAILTFLTLISKEVVRNRKKPSEGESNG